MLSHSAIFVSFLLPDLVPNFVEQNLFPAEEFVSSIPFLELVQFTEMEYPTVSLSTCNDVFLAIIHSTSLYDIVAICLQ